MIIDAGRTIDAARVAERQGDEAGRDERLIGCADLLPELVEAHRRPLAVRPARPDHPRVARGRNRRGLADHERWREDTDRRGAPTTCRLTVGHRTGAAPAARARSVAEILPLPIPLGRADGERDRLGSHRRDRHPDRREAGDRRSRHRDVVEADHREVVGHLDAAQERAAQDADRERRRSRRRRRSAAATGAAARRARPRRPRACSRRAGGTRRGPRRGSPTPPPRRRSVARGCRRAGGRR